ncbi:MAG: ABC transporter permease [Anaerolineae bacterium]|jgi:peptide/nickel transport system permease protein|nr:ABC transporter permease [Anaerolineae bacterium]
MINYIFRRIGYMMVTLVIIAILGYLIVELPPGSYLEFEIARLRQQGGNVSQDQIRALEIRYGLNDPTYVRFFKWIGGFVRGDFGESFQYRQEVSDLIFQRLGFTVGVSVFSLFLAWGIAVPVGVYSATHRNTIPDYIVTVLQFLGLSVPSFLIALVLMVVAQRVFGQQVGGLFSDQYRNAPWSFAKFIDALKHLWIPIVVIAFGSTAGLSRIMRANLLDVLNMQYVQTARSKGLTERTVIWKHAVKNAMHPLIMILGGSLPGIISGETVVALVMNIPTVGPMYFNAQLNQDLYLAATFLMFLAVVGLIGNLLADIALAWVDPRIRFE